MPEGERVVTGAWAEPAIVTVWACTCGKGAINRWFTGLAKATEEARKMAEAHLRSHRDALDAARYEVALSPGPYVGQLDDVHWSPAIPQAWTGVT